MVRFRSVVSRIVALHIAAIVATSICMPLALYLMLRHAVEELHEQALCDQAGEIVRYLSIAPDGSVRLTLPPSLAEFYSRGYGRAAYAVIDANGRVLFSSLSGNRAISNVRPDGGAAAFFQQDRVGAIAPVRAEGSPVAFFHNDRYGAALYGATLAVDFHGRPILVQVVEDVLHRDVLIDDILAQFPTHVGWITAPILLLLLLIDVAIFRRAMQPIIAASSMAGKIGPDRIDLRLPEANMPLEVLPLVRAVNRALERLDAGFRAQREFTADAAHELRTPLAILRTQIDMVEDREIAEPLRQDVESMSRLVNQLLEISELDSFFVADGETADIVAIAAEIAAFLAPLALSKNKMLAVIGADHPVRVHGNADAIARALRNLAENALTHTAPGTTVELAVAEDATIRVLDRGPGVPKTERQHIFKRFWRRDRRGGGHAGLGLAIVARIVEMHGASISVEDRPGGGAVFVLRFPAVLRGARAASELAAVH
ncbi:MAG TPA: ATP-binding protein [Stellaceae bacterium]|nr:ATP-binding protein [Stellaceae bacterium]